MLHEIIEEDKKPLPDYLTNGILIYFLLDHRFLYIQKRYEPNRKLWYQRIKKNDQNFDNDVDNYYVHKHKDVIKINTNTNTNNMIKEDKNSLIPSTNIWVGLLRPQITEGNLNLYYNGKYTTLKISFDLFLNRYLFGLKNIIVNKTNGNVSKKEDVLIEKWMIFPDIPSNQSIFIL